MICRITDECVFNPWEYDEEDLTPSERERIYDEAHCDDECPSFDRSEES